MSSLFILIPIAIVFVTIAILVFLWAVRHDQFEDLTRQGQSILWERDEDLEKPQRSKESPR